MNALILLALLAIPAGQDPPAIRWRSDLAKTLERAKVTGKPVLVAYFAAWCGSCRRFRSNTLPASEVQSLAGRFHWVMVDIDRNVTLARTRNVLATPRFDLIDSRGVTRTQISGVLPPDEFSGHLLGFLEEVDKPAVGPLSVIPGDTRTPLTWSPEGYRGLAICFSNVGYGPLHLPTQSPFQSLRFGFQPRTPSTLAKGHVEVRLTETWANLWAFEKSDFLIDYEMLRSSFSVAYGISDVLQV